MLATLFASFCLAIGTIGTNSQQFTFHPPKAEPFLNMDFYVGWPVNATTVDNLLAITPNLAGTVSGHVQGSLVGNTTASVETFFNSEAGIFSDYQNQFLIETDNGENVWVKMSGIAQYANGGLHGFAQVTFRTDVPKLGWMNYGLFVGEWIGATNSGTGNAKLDIFEVSTGGRLDGKPIEAIEPGTK